MNPSYGAEYFHFSQGARGWRALCGTSPTQKSRRGQTHRLRAASRVKPGGPGLGQALREAAGAGHGKQPLAGCTWDESLTSKPGMW